MAEAGTRTPDRVVVITLAQDRVVVSMRAKEWEEVLTLAPDRVVVSTLAKDRVQVRTAVGATAIRLSGVVLRRGEAMSTLLGAAARFAPAPTAE